MAAVITLLVTVTLSLIIGRVATMAFMATGLSRESARFQARSAFTGVGYTTSEAESIVDHPVRRRIAMKLMLLGNVGITAVVATSIVSLLSINRGGNRLWEIAVLVVGFGLLWALAASHWVEVHLNRYIARALRKYTRLNVQDFVALMHLGEGYGVTELKVGQRDWLVDKSLAELDLPEEGVLVLGIQRHHGPYIGTPRGETPIQADDRLLLYGRLEQIAALDTRRAGRRGDTEHAAAIEEQNSVEAREEAEDPAVQSK